MRTELPSIKARKKVLAKYPAARVQRDGALFFVSIGKGYDKVDLGAGFSKAGAWCSAGYHLPGQ